MCPSPLPNTNALRWVLTTDHTALYHWVTISGCNDAVAEKVSTGHTHDEDSMSLPSLSHGTNVMGEEAQRGQR